MITREAVEGVSPNTTLGGVRCSPPTQFSSTHQQDYLLHHHMVLIIKLLLMKTSILYYLNSWLNISNLIYPYVFTDFRYVHETDQRLQNVALGTLPAVSFSNSRWENIGSTSLSGNALFRPSKSRFCSDTALHSCVSNLNMDSERSLPSGILDHQYCKSRKVDLLLIYNNEYFLTQYVRILIIN